MITREFLADPIGATGVLNPEIASVADRQVDLFAEGQEVSARGYLAELVGDDPWTAEVVGCGVVDRMVWFGLGRILRDQFS